MIDSHMTAVNTSLEKITKTRESISYAQGIIDEEKEKLVNKKHDYVASLPRARKEDSDNVSIDIAPVIDALSLNYTKEMDLLRDQLRLAADEIKLIVAKQELLSTQHEMDNELQ